MDITQWGNVKLHNEGSQFKSAINLILFSAIDIPDITNLTNMSKMFGNRQLNPC